MPIVENMIDLSHWEGSVNMAQIKRDGIFIVAHKATQGIGQVDDRYRARMAEAKALNLVWFGYHFGDASNPAGQAAHFLKVANLVEGDGACMDFEDYPASQMSLSQCTAALAAVDKGHPVVGKTWLYSGNTIREHLTPKTASPSVAAFYLSHPLFRARYSSVEGVPPWPWHKDTAWQYSESAHILGVTGNSDADIFHGTLADVRAMLRFANSTMPVAPDEVRSVDPVEETKKIQTELNVIGVQPPLDVDGLWGAKTSASVKAFQAAKGLDADGIAGPKTRSALELAYKAASTPEPAPAGKKKG